MFSGVTPAAILTNAAAFSSSFEGPILIAIGLGIAVFVGNWIVSKLRRG